MTYFAFEIDGLISEPVESLTKLDNIHKQKVIDGAVGVLKKIKEKGHFITLYTKRDVSTALDTQAWLDKNKIPHDNIIFNRPVLPTLFFSADFRQFVSWQKVEDELKEYGFIEQ